MLPGPTAGPLGAHFCRGVPRSPHCSARRARACGCSGSAARWKLARSLQSASRTSAGAAFPVNLRTGSSLWGEGMPWGVCWGKARGCWQRTLKEQPLPGASQPSYQSPGTSCSAQMTAKEDQNTADQPQGILLWGAAPGVGTGPPQEGLECQPVLTPPLGRGCRGALRTGWKALWACRPHPSSGMTRGPCHSLVLTAPDNLAPLSPAPS